MVHISQKTGFVISHFFANNNVDILYQLCPFLTLSFETIDFTDLLIQTLHKCPLYANTAKRGMQAIIIKKIHMTIFFAVKN